MEVFKGVIEQRAQLLRLYSVRCEFAIRRHRQNDTDRRYRRTLKKKICLDPSLSITNPQYQPGIEPGFRDLRPTTKDLSEGTAHWVF